MADNPNKKGADARKVSRQSWEYPPVKEAVKKIIPDVADAKIRQVFNEVKGAKNPPTNRPEVVQAVAKKAKKL